MSGVFQKGVLSDIAHVTMGQSPKKEFVSPEEQGLPLLNGPTEFGSSHPTPVQWATSFSKTAEPGDILFCVRGSAGRMNWADRKYAIGRGIASISAINPQERHFVRGAINLALPELLAAATGSTFPNVSRLQLSELPVAIPPVVVRTEISRLLGALDDKIESNRRQRTLCRQLGLALVTRLEYTATEYCPLEDFALSISRGIAPKYYKDEDVEPVMVLNQRCIREGWVSPNAARLMLPRMKAKDAGIAERGDLLVNSTGQGTLGRVGRWSYEDSLYVDSHVTVVKPDRTQIAPTLLSYLVLPRQPEIEEMAEGSTGQTELSPNRLGSLNLPVIPQVEQELIEPKLLALEEEAHVAAVETAKLEALRDALLPELMSGRIRVPEARDAIDEEVGDVEIQ
ncbi:MAG: restriction endonuclease subunit S [Actinomycetaceae bacterium]|nr:restriction endonuclease subunit S [Actinomycetaceae bacterium]